MDIVGKTERVPLVAFTTPEDYLFGTRKDALSGQGGVYNRTMHGIR